MSEERKLKRFWIQELTRPAFEEWPESEPSPLAIIGLGSIEQHNLHLPLGTDSLFAREFIHEVAKRTNSVCVHPCWPGYSPHHKGFRGTITFSEETMNSVIMDTIESLAEHGIKRILIMNFHGGNDNILKLAIQVARREHKAMAFSPTMSMESEFSKKVREKSERTFDAHAGVSETAPALLVFPELVEMWRIEDWESTFRVPPGIMELIGERGLDQPVVRQVFSACLEPNNHDFSSSGQWGIADPRKSDPEEARKLLEEGLEFLVEFVNLWKTIPVPPGFK